MEVKEPTNLAAQGGHVIFALRQDKGRGADLDDGRSKTFAGPSAPPYIICKEYKVFHFWSLRVVFSSTIFNEKS
jgi:hypothetical protein